MVEIMNEANHMFEGATRISGGGNKLGPDAKDDFQRRTSEMAGGGSDINDLIKPEYLDQQ